MAKEAGWELIGWLLRGKQRHSVFGKLPEDPVTPQELRKSLNKDPGLGLSLREMSRHLNDFVERKLVACLTPDAPYGRLYQLTLQR